jgi:hypothetical protein
MPRKKTSQVVINKILGLHKAGNRPAAIIKELGKDGIKTVTGRTWKADNIKKYIQIYGGKAAKRAAAVPQTSKRATVVQPKPADTLSWMAMEKGNVCHGKLLGRYKLKSTRYYYYQVELLNPCQVRVASGLGSEAAAGDVINLIENRKLECLKDVEIPEILAGAEYEIFIKVVNKIEVHSGKTVWNIDVSTKAIKEPSRPPVATAVKSQAPDARNENLLAVTDGGQQPVLTKDVIVKQVTSLFSHFAAHGVDIREISKDAQGRMKVSFVQHHTLAFPTSP